MPLRSAPLRLAGAAILAALLGGCDRASGPDRHVVPEALTITDADVHRWISLLAHDSMMGRQTPSAQLEQAATAIAGHFQRLGLRGAFGGGFHQYYPLGDSGSAPNVGAVLPGSDARLRNEYVVFVAHFDHKGVGLPEDYHKVTDTVDRIDAEKAARVVRMVFYLGLDVANAEVRPAWKPGWAELGASAR